MLKGESSLIDIGIACTTPDKVSIAEISWELLDFKHVEKGAPFLKSLISQARIIES